MQKNIDSEKLVERKLVELVVINNGLCIKLLSTHVNGLPDRMCLFPGQRIYFVELKTTGQKPRPSQIVVHKAFERLGFIVEVLDSVDSVEKFIYRVMTTK